MTPENATSPKPEDEAPQPAVRRSDVFGLSHVGRVRDHNEDHFLVAHLRKVMLVDQTSLSLPDHSCIEADREGLLLVVADGVGGRPGGEIASSVVVDTLSDYALNTMPWFTRAAAHDPCEELEEALRRSEHLIKQLTRRNPLVDGMATTLVMAYVSGADLCVAHLGDSRAYIFSDDRLERVTRDHTVAQEMLDSGRLSEEEARESKWDHVLRRALGAGEAIPDVFTAEVDDGDILLLCSDGLTKHVGDTEIAGVLRTMTTTELAVRQLRDLALARGGTDNVTIVCARFSDESTSDDTSAHEVVPASSS